MAVSRQVKESPLTQGTYERIAYTVDTSPWGGYSSAGTTAIWDITNKDQYTDMSATMLSGSTTATGNVITTPLVISLVPGNRYRLEVSWVYNGNTLETYALINAEK